MNFIDRAVAYLSPAAGVERAHSRRVMAYYDAAESNRLRKGRSAPGTGNAAVQFAGRTLREQARYFEQNHDLARGVLADLVLKTVGPYGIACEPQPRNTAGEIHDAFAAELDAAWKDWCKTPEVTWQHDWASMQRLMCRSWVRDGESFAQALAGTVPFLDHGTRVPLSLEMIEADLCPIEYSLAPSIAQGVELNAWGRPRAYHLFKTPPNDIRPAAPIGELKRIPAERILHVKLVDRIRQLRGVSIFASVLTRFDDLKDYEESERIAAKVAASMAAFIKKGSPELYEPPVDGEQRDLKFRAGMVFDDLMPGEEIGTIDTKRPNPNLLPYRQGQMRGAASGTGTSYSSISKDYNGTYSAQRQELVESWASYATLAAEFTSAFIRPVYELFVATAILAGAVKVPREVVAGTENDAIYIAPEMPWIDPEKEAKADVLNEGAILDSGPAIIRRRGRVPRDVLAQESKWRRQLAEAGLEPELIPSQQQERGAA